MPYFNKGNDWSSKFLAKSPFKRTKDATGPSKNQKSAQYGSFDELLNSTNYKRNQKSKDYQKYTYWDRSGDKPTVYEYEKNIENKPKKKG